MKRSLAMLGAAAALSLLGLTATTAEAAAVKGAPHRVKANIH